MDLRDNVWGLKKKNTELKREKMQMENDIVDARRNVTEVKGRHATKVAVLKNKLEEKKMVVVELAVRVQKQNMFKFLFYAVVVSIVVFSMWANW